MNYLLNEVHKPHFINFKTGYRGKKKIPKFVKEKNITRLLFSKRWKKKLDTSHKRRELK